MIRKPRLDTKTGSFYVSVGAQRLQVRGTSIRGMRFGDPASLPNEVKTPKGDVVKLNWTSVFTRTLVKRAQTALRKMNALKAELNSKKHNS